ncbi:MAG: hypothetical protein IJE16_07490 [Ruminococcus sp.]|nr:hypothetical protein [Ruminococcus sp.]
MLDNFFETLQDVVAQTVNFNLFGQLYTCIMIFVKLFLYVCLLLINLMSGGFDELISNGAVQAYLSLLEVFASFLFVAGTAFSMAEWAINTNEGGASGIMSTFKYIILGLFATLGFTTIPILLMQFTAWCTQILISSVAVNSDVFIDNLSKNFANFNTDKGGAILWIVFCIIFIVCIIKIFLSNMKRGGVLLIQLFACPIHIFNIPRGRVDAFFSWCKQVLALYLTTFTQNFLMSLGIMMVGASSGITTSNMCLCIGVLLASAEAPQILQQFGLDTSVKASPSQAIFAASGVTNIVSSLSRMA